MLNIIQGVKGQGGGEEAAGYFKVGVAHMVHSIEHGLFVDAFIPCDILHKKVCQLRSMKGNSINMVDE